MGIRGPEICSRSISEWPMVARFALDLGGGEEQEEEGVSS
jgi:hypothetical protein